MKVLVTGGAGFIGSWLVEKLLDRNDDVVVLDNLSPQIHGEIPSDQVDTLKSPNVRFVRGDIRDRKLLEKCLHDVDAVVHLAAETGTGQSMYEVEHYTDVNVNGTSLLLELIGTKYKNVKKFVIASSRSIYGEGAYLQGDKLVVPEPRTAETLENGGWEVKGVNGEALTLVATPENAPANPASIYAATKLANEHFCAVFASAYQLPTIALRFQNVYGERQSLKNPYTGILSIFSNKFRRSEKINIFEDGLESRDFVHVEDVVNSICLALDVESDGFHAVNVGSGEPTSVLDIANHLKNFYESDSEIEITGDYRIGDIRHCYADLTLAKEFLKFTPSITLEDGLSRFASWVLTQELEEDLSAVAQAELAEKGLGKKA